MKFLENLSEFTGGARGGLGAVGEVLAAAAMGEASARPGERIGAGAARGFAMGVGGLGDAFARGRAMRDKDRVRVMAAEKLKDPNLGAAERDLWAAVASGNTAALDLFDETLAARASDRADLAREDKLAYYAAKAAAEGAPKPLNNDEIRHNKNVLEARKRLMENPTLFDQLDMGDPDSLTGKAMDTYKGVPDPEHGAIHRWLSTDALSREGLPGLLGEIQREYGAEGLDSFSSRYGFGGTPPMGDPTGAPETGGAAADVADTEQSGGAADVIDAVAGAIGGPAGAPSLFDTEYGGLLNRFLGTNFTGRQAKQSEMDSLLGELDAAARGEAQMAPPVIRGGGILDQPGFMGPGSGVDPVFNAITGGGAGAGGTPSGPNLMGREDELRRRSRSLADTLFPAFGPGFYRDPSVEDAFTRTLRTTGRDLRASAAEVPGALARVPSDFMSALRSVNLGPGSLSAEVDAYGAGRAAGRDLQRAFEPLTSRMAPYSELSPSLQQEREEFLRALGWGG